MQNTGSSHWCWRRLLPTPSQDGELSKTIFSESLSEPENFHNNDLGRKESGPSDKYQIKIWFLNLAAYWNNLGEL